MSTGYVVGRNYLSGQPIELAWANGTITKVAPVAEPCESNVWLAPALVDLQVNGFAGVDFQRDQLRLEDLLTAARGLRRAGCSRFLLTLITDRWPDLMQRLRHLRALRSSSPELGLAIAGWHLEGPFLSSEPGFHGAHDPELMLDPSVEQIKELRAVTGGDPTLLTIAPERPGAIEAIRLAVSLGIKVSLGHTNASMPQLREAIAAGATGFTHLGNACPKLLDRSDNILWRVLDLPGLMIGIIPDQIHVAPPLFRVLHRAAVSRTFYYTTDAMSAAGMPPGRYPVGKLEADVGADQVVRRVDNGNLAGSALRPIDGVFRAAAMLGKSWRELWHFHSVDPARWMGLTSGLQPGQCADFCQVIANESGALERVETWRNGEPES